MSRKNRMSSADADYLDGLLEAFADLSDGAWRAACESTIESDPRFRGRDPYGVWLAWCERKSKSAAAPPSVSPAPEHKE